MLNVNVIFKDSEAEALKEAKGDKTWHNFILECAQKIYSSEHEDAVQGKVLFSKQIGDEWDGMISLELLMAIFIRDDL